MEGNIKQKSGSNSTNLQIAGNVTVGITATEARQIALDVFKANFYELSEKAGKIAAKRAEEITEEFIKKSYKQFPDVNLKLEEPSMQYSIFNVQKEYAKTGDANLKEQLLQILLERINSDENSLKQIILDEAINTVPKLTQTQINFLSLIFSVININHYEVTSISSFNNCINNKIMCFYSTDIGQKQFYSHILYSNCCSMLSEGSTYKPLEEIFLSRYKGLFNKGFTEAEFVSEVDTNIDLYRNLFIRCQQDISKIQLNAMNDDVLKSSLQKFHITENTDKIIGFFNKTTMSIDEVKNVLIKINPQVNQLLNLWRNDQIKVLNLTSVGMSIAILNYNKMTNENIAIDTLI